jgi:hypothetical protein
VVWGGGAAAALVAEPAGGKSAITVHTNEEDTCCVWRPSFFSAHHKSEDRRDRLFLMGLFNVTLPLTFH